MGAVVAADGGKRGRSGNMNEVPEAIPGEDGVSIEV